MSLDREQMAKIVEPYATTSDRIRALAAAGAPRAEIARFLGKRYQHVRNVLVDDAQRSGGYQLGRADLSGVREEPARFDRSDEAAFVERRGRGAFWLRVRPDGSIYLPDEVVEAARRAARQSGFRAPQGRRAEAHQRRGGDGAGARDRAQVHPGRGRSGAKPARRPTRGSGRRGPPWLTRSLTRQPSLPTSTTSRAAKSSGQWLRTSVMSAVNFAEVVSQLILHGVPPHEAGSVTHLLRFEVVNVDEQTASAAGALHARTRRSGISLADAFCLALAQELCLPAFTTDRAWATLDLDVEVRLIR